MKLTKKQREAIWDLGQTRSGTPDGIAGRTLQSLSHRSLAEVRHEYAPKESRWRLTEKGREQFKTLFC